MTEEFRIGDLCSMDGPSVPLECVGRYFRVTSVGPNGPILTMLPVGEGERELALKETLEAHRRGEVSGWQWR